jgi:hypothetical protein
MQKAGKGEAGLLISEISDKWPFDGYTDPAKTQSVIFRDVFKKGDAWFNTGDLMRDLGSSTPSSSTASATPSAGRAKTSPPPRWKTSSAPTRTWRTRWSTAWKSPAPTAAAAWPRCA